MEDREVININSRVIDMQVIEFDSIIENRFIPVPESVRLTSGLPVRVVVLFSDQPKYALSELLAQCDFSQPMTAEEREWLDAPAVRQEEL
jgi:antitoxin ChpS